MPFRIQIDTYAMASNGKLGRYLHSASCQIKVFKPKGADRKLKTDKDKLDKRSAQDKLKYQPSYDSTLLSECLPLPLAPEQVEDKDVEESAMIDQISDMVAVYSNSINSSVVKSRLKGSSQSNNISNAIIKSVPAPSLGIYSNAVVPQQPSTHLGLLSSSTPQQTQEWLEIHRFRNFIKPLNSYSGSDLLALSRDDIIQICGPAEGIRLYNALRAKLKHPRLTLYLTSASQAENGGFPIYRAFYLEQAGVGELLKAARQCLLEDGNITKQTKIGRILYQPRCTNIHVLVTNEVVAQMKDESSFSVNLVKHGNMESFQVVLRPQN